MPIGSDELPLEVLVVDDDDGIRELILSYFTGMGMLASGAEDGAHAIAMLQRSRGRFRLVVTDLNLPGADGFAVLQAAKQANAACNVVIVTGYASLDSAIQAVRVGAHEYLTKPFSLSALDQIVKRITGDGAADVPVTSLTKGHPPPAPPPPPTPMEQRVASIEASLERLENFLHQQARERRRTDGEVSAPRHSRRV